jgi:hypothetical protein
MPGDRTQDEEIARLIRLGATIVSDRRPDVGWVIMADPEGNEFCVEMSRAELDAALAAESSGSAWLKLLIPPRLAVLESALPALASGGGSLFGYAVLAFPISRTTYYLPVQFSSTLCDGEISRSARKMAPTIGLPTASITTESGTSDPVAALRRCGSH